jgi:ABC-type xylose transport system substrate-binding protein
VQYTAKYDGKDYPVTGSQDFDAISLKRVDAGTAQATLKKGGKVIQTATRVVSKDGKTLTLTTIGANAKGQAVNNVLVFDKR